MKIENKSHLCFTINVVKAQSAYLDSSLAIFLYKTITIKNIGVHICVEIWDTGGK